VVKIATFAKPETVVGKAVLKDSASGQMIDKIFQVNKI
jgi:hypothetical protein